MTAVGTGTVLMLNDAVVAPAAMVTDAGTVATALLELRITTTPPTGAGALRVTVQILGVPPTTLLGLSVSFTVNPGIGTDAIPTEIPLEINPINELSGDKTARLKEPR